MPGIVGIISKMPRQRAEAELRRMVGTLRHEAFYVDGTWIDESLGLYVGWVARDGAFADTMPLRSEDGNLTVTFSGEEFPEPGIQQRLKEAGHVLDANPAGYIIHLAEEDTAFPKGLNGRFHGLLADRRARTAVLFNDRYGMHRIYYHESPEAFYFSAEAKAILAVFPALREADNRGLGEFVACGCVLEDRTFFKDIHVLPPASAWLFRNGTIAAKDKYFEASEWEDQEPLDPEAYYQHLREVFSRNLPRYFDGREKLAVSLTGGLDTRMIMAWHKATPGSLPTYTFGGPFKECQDVIIARKVARACDQPHQVIPVGDDFLSRFPHYAERAIYLSDGCAAVNRSADLYANELAAMIAPVRMTGNYGSEILRRLRAFKPVDPAEGLFRQEFLDDIRATRDTFNRIAQGHAVSFTAFRQAPWYQYGLLALEQTQLSLRSPFLDNEIVKAAYRAPKSEITKTDIFEDSDDCCRLIADGNPSLSQITTDRGLGGGDGVVRAVSRAVLEITFRAEYAYDYGMPQWLAQVDHGFSALHLERLFLGRHKFCHYRVWYRDQLAHYVREILLDERTLSRRYIDRSVLENMVLRHLKGDANYTNEIHRLLTLELLHRLFIDA